MACRRASRIVEEDEHLVKDVAAHHVIVDSETAEVHETATLKKLRTDGATRTAEIPFMHHLINGQIFEPFINAERMEEAKHFITRPTDVVRRACGDRPPTSPCFLLSPVLSSLPQDSSPDYFP